MSTNRKGTLDRDRSATRRQDRAEASRNNNTPPEKKELLHAIMDKREHLINKGEF